MRKILSLCHLTQYSPIDYLLNGLVSKSPREFSNEAIDHYKKVLDCCHENNLQTCVTFQHFTSPLWFTAKGGWEKENADLYVKYAEFVTKELVTV